MESPVHIERCTPGSEGGHPETPRRKPGSALGAYLTRMTASKR